MALKRIVEKRATYNSLPCKDEQADIAQTALNHKEVNDD